MFFLYDDIYLNHDTGFLHPENHIRLTAINDVLKTKDYYSDLKKIYGKQALVEDINLVHDLNYIKTVENNCKDGYTILSTGDTSINTESYKIALYAVGGILNGIDLIFKGVEKRGFCAVRPPGHHASKSRGMGFCIFNNIAIAARYAQKRYHVEKVLIIDWDVHHGNGTQDIFYEDNSVYFMSIHQYPFYPGTGRSDDIGFGKGRGYTKNKPLPAGTTNQKVIEIFKNDFYKAAEKFKPDLTLISAGFDSRVNEPLGFLSITDDGFKELTKIVIDIAEIAGKGRIVSILEGGYNPKGLGTAVSEHISALLNF